MTTQDMIDFLITGGHRPAPSNPTPPKAAPPPKVVPFSSFAEYVSATEKRFHNPGVPAALWAGKLWSGWKIHCAKTGRNPAQLVAVDEERAKKEEEGTAAWWQKRAVEEADRARSFGGEGSILAFDTMRDAWLALNGRTPSGQPMAAGAQR